MNVRLVFHGSLKRYNGGVAESTMELPEGTCVSDLIDRVQVPQDELAFVAINGSRALASEAIHDGDEVKFFQMVAGG